MKTIAELARKARKFAQLPLVQLVRKRSALAALLEELATVIMHQENLLRVARQKIEKAQEKKILRITTNRRPASFDVEGQKYVEFGSIRRHPTRVGYWAIIARWPGESGDGAAIYVSDEMLRAADVDSDLWAALMGQLRKAHQKLWKDYVREAEMNADLPDWREINLRDPGETR